MNKSNTTSFTVVTDPGIDDLVALCLLKALTPGVSHTLVSTFGNGPVSVTGKNAREFVAGVASGWGYNIGATKPVNGTLEHPYPDYFHGPDAAWGVHILQDVPDIVETPDAGGHVISLGPMSEVANLAQKNRIRSLAVMGGAFSILGNETPYAETNIAFDPDAAAEVFAGNIRIPTTVVPLDVTRTVFWDHRMVSTIPETNPGATWIKRMILAWETNYSHEREEAFNLHDPLAVYLTFFPDAAEWIESGVQVVTEGEKRGQTVYDPHQPPCRIAVKIHDPAEVAREIATLVAMV